MKFFKKKDKRKDAGHGGMPSFGSGTAGPYSDATLSGGDSRSGALRSFGSAPLRDGDPRRTQLGHFQPMATRASALVLANLPAPILERIFAFVCPHSQDESYDNCEESSIDDACMLCDMRDLAHCAGVSKKWRSQAIKQLYHSIRIDTVHYCDREAILAERRKRRSFFDRNGEPEDTSQARLKLLSRTLREDPVRLGRVVQFLKMPYMLRESCQADLARTIAVTPNIRYVDLPEGLFTDDPSFITLRLEVQARCLELRKMTYMGGSERSLQALATGTVWTHLEVLELARINVDPAMLRQVLGCLGNLRALKITETAYISDQTLAWSDLLPPFPALEELILNDVPNLTAEGLKAWLAMPAAREALRVITLNNTGVHVWALQDVLVSAPGLKHMSIMNSVTTTMPVSIGPHTIPHLSSTNLETLHYEITAAPTSPKFSGIASSYYYYLAESLLSGGLPNLRAVYVRDPDFPDLLLGLPPPVPAFAEGAIARPASSGSNTAFSPRYSNYSSYGGYNSNNLSPGFSPTSPGYGGLSPSTTGASFGPPQPHIDNHGNPFANSPGPFQPQQSGYIGNNNPRFSSNNPFAAMATGSAGGSVANLPAKLEVFTKGDDELGWSFVSFGTASAARLGPGGTSGRPLSSYGLGNDILGGSSSGWNSGSGARRSVLVGGAGGGFLAVPGEGTIRGRASGLGGGGSGGGGGSSGEELWPRPLSSAGESKRERKDLWR